MAFHSILSDNRETPAPPDCFTDLNLDQIIDAVTAEKVEYELKPFFYTPLRDTDTIAYRHEVMRDLENEPLLGQIKSFAQKVRTTREYLVQAEKLRCQLQRQRWFLDAAATYCEAVQRLERDLAPSLFGSRGFKAFYAYLKDYAHSDAFTRLLADTKMIGIALSAIRYCVLIGGPDGTRNHAVCVEVRKYNGEPDYSAEVEKTFEKFKQGGRGL
jgi:DNA mismatch repair protein MutS